MQSNSLVPFKYTLTFNASSSGFTAGNQDLVLGNMGARLAAMIGLFKKWRLKRLHVKMVLDGASSANISAGNAGVTGVTGYMGAPIANASAPTTTAEVLTMMYADLTNGQQAAQYEVPFSTLHEAANGDFLLTNVGSYPTSDSSQGTLWSALQIGQTLTTGSVRAYVIVSGIAEFCEPTTPTVDLALTSIPLEITHYGDEEKEWLSETSRKSTSSAVVLKRK